MAIHYNYKMLHFMRIDTISTPNAFRRNSVFFSSCFVVLVVLPSFNQLQRFCLILNDFAQLSIL